MIFYEMSLEIVPENILFLFKMNILLNSADFF